MKKKLFFALLVLILSSCSLFFQKEYGTITIDLEGGRARSINSSTGLPNLADSELEIDILTEGNSSIYKKILASEPKFFQADFPIGSRLEITVKLNGPSSSWSAHNSHTVKEGNNDIRLLLNKNASSLANVGFSTTATNTYEFNIAGEKIDIISRGLPVFTRDSRGRLYIAYKQSNWKLNRYESDGTQNNFVSGSQILSTINTASSVKLASDSVTGKVYVAADSHLYLIKDDGSVIAVSPTIPAGPIAVYNNNLFALDSPATSTDLKMFTMEEGSGLTLNQAGSTVSVSTEQITISGTPIDVDFKDILVKKDKIYILFAKNKLPTGTPPQPSPYYSLGGMLEYTYNSSGINGLQKYGFKNEVTAKDGIVTAGEANFYGPACFIGYDEQSISIADDGCTFKKVGGNVKIDKNVNRIFSFNTSTKSLYSYATENKWFKEYEETGGTTPPPPHPGTGKVLLWEKNSAPNLGMVYYQVDEGGYTGLLTAFIEGSNTGGNIEDPTDVFCYDQEGNLYVVWNNTSNFYCVRRYEKKSDGSYDTANVKEQALKGSGSTYLNSSNPPIAIAVDVSDSTNGYLYYGYKDGTNTPMRISRWNKTNFETVIENKNVQIDNKFKITAMAANKEGAFVAVKQNYTTPPAGYKINILKYKNDSSSHGYWYFYNSAQNHSSGDNYKDENIFAMKVVNDILFFLITRQKGQMNNLSTNTVKIEAELWRTQYPLSGNFNDQRYQDLWKSKDEDHQHGYAPYRFIGTVPNKLIIASDGYYGDKSSIGNEAQNKNKVLSFGIGSWTVTPTDTNAKFSRELTYGSSGFEWK
ncbi:hypothetical protein KP612_06055 [Treponema denticola]|uniref:Major fimbrial subunit protein N-terminal domain-containing protein n=1 Tax=Treponema denticola H-22 TaxID=999432 RepID=A0A0E2E8A0_TREDN|nr:hypothetical protein [Treponema denticola]EMB36219.1 hypothetical protein HMPREF9726_00411 [Treponema denticola H-22]